MDQKLSKYHFDRHFTRHRSGYFFATKWKTCSKKGPKTGSDLEQLSFANRNLWGLLFRTVDKFWEFYRRVHDPVQSAYTPRWNSLNSVTNERTNGRTFQFEAPGKEISASRKNRCNYLLKWWNHLVFFPVASYTSLLARKAVSWVLPSFCQDRYYFLWNSASTYLFFKEAFNYSSLWISISVNPDAKHSCRKPMF